MRNHTRATVYFSADIFKPYECRLPQLIKACPNAKITVEFA
jgi:hypothetical protein